jgi:hypothetical protein
MWPWETRQPDRRRCARRQGGSQGFRQQGGPGRTRRPQGGSPHDSLARRVHVLFAEESRAQVRGRDGLGDDGASLLQKGVPGLLGDLGA